MDDGREEEEEEEGKGESEMSLIFNMFKYANPLKRARAKLGSIKKRPETKS